MSEGEKKKAGTGLKELFKLYRFLKPYRWTFALGMLFLLISSGTSLMFPKFLGDMVDLGNKGKLMSEISRTGLIKEGLGNSTAVVLQTYHCRGYKT